MMIETYKSNFKRHCQAKSKNMQNQKSNCKRHYQHATYYKQHANG